MHNLVDEQFHSHNIKETKTGYWWMDMKKLDEIQILERIFKLFQFS